MNVKKNLFIALISFLSLSAFGCSVEERTEVSDYVINETTESTEESEIIFDETALSVESVDIYDYEGDKIYQTIRYPVVNYKNNKNLQDSLDVLNAEMKKSAEDFKSQNKNEIRKYIKEHPDMSEAEYSHTSDITITKNTERYLSFTEYVYEFMMGAHGNYVQNGHTYDVKTGKKLGLDDFIKDREELRTFLKNWIKENKDIGFFDEAEIVVDSYINGEYDLQFYLSDGVTITFQPYDVAPYAAGLIEVKLTENLLKVNLDDI